MAASRNSSLDVQAPRGMSSFWLPARARGLNRPLGYQGVRGRARASGRRDLVLLDDGVYSLYLPVADCATPSGARLTAIFPRTGRRATLVARREAGPDGDRPDPACRRHAGTLNRRTLKDGLQRLELPAGRYVVEPWWTPGKEVIGRILRRSLCRTLNLPAKARRKVGPFPLHHVGLCRRRWAHCVNPHRLDARPRGGAATSGLDHRPPPLRQPPSRCGRAGPSPNQEARPTSRFSNNARPPPRWGSGTRTATSCESQRLQRAGYTGSGESQSAPSSRIPNRS